MTAPAVARSRPASDDYTLHELTDRRFVIWEKPRGRDRFKVMECGAGRRGMGRTRCYASSLDAALELVATLTPSTPAEILAALEFADCFDRDLRAKLIALRHARNAAVRARRWRGLRVGQRGTGSQRR